MTSVSAHSKGRLLIEESMSVDKCDCAHDHPAHRNHGDGQGPAGHWALERRAVDEDAQR